MSGLIIARRSSVTGGLAMVVSFFKRKGELGPEPPDDAHQRDEGTDQGHIKDKVNTSPTQDFRHQEPP